MWRSEAGIRLPVVAHIINFMLDLSAEDPERQRARNALLANTRLARHILRLAKQHVSEVCVHVVRSHV
jgi:hypothetical protein